ncbi:uncharacterized protein HfgLR_21400 (plasmid) [Haloferax gibbonsii]|uniref:Uncharacterized protein n=1 Tax=Haloferax gibbonsii TaxID=35746 RepID=A0A871BKD2_HALGI|nr:uncharacterized protein HfgLR_21400 [Haloferax gibbonsii]
MRHQSFRQQEPQPQLCDGDADTPTAWRDILEETKYVSFIAS